ncbi:MAG: 30S ribosomal protein S9 [Nanoarchaeota archaeon]
MITKPILVSGKRKRAIARATIKKGKGIVRINHQLLQNVEPRFSRMRIEEPLMIASEFSDKVNIDINVRGGGFQSQAEAARLCVAKGLLAFAKSKQLKQDFLNYDRHLLIADVRRGEPSKPNDSKPRKARTKSYR